MSDAPNGEIVLTLTDNAQDAIRRLLDSPLAGHVVEGGLRIAPTDAGQLRLALQTEPAPGDDVVEQNGVRVFLEPTASELLHNRTLDAVLEEGGEASFFITE